MRPATELITNEEAVEYCKAILSAETEEEIEVIKQEITSQIKAKGYEDSVIKAYLDYLDFIAGKLESEEAIVDEDGHFIVNPVKESENVTLQPTETTTQANTSQANTAPGVLFGIAGALLVMNLAIKKKVLKNKQSKTR